VRERGRERTRVSGRETEHVRARACVAYVAYVFENFMKPDSGCSKEEGNINLALENLGSESFLDPHLSRYAILFFSLESFECP